MPFKVSSERYVPEEVIRELTNGSFEHLSLRIDNAIAENISKFVGESNARVARIATFKDKVTVGTSDGRYFTARYEDIDSKIYLSEPEQLDVQVVDSVNVNTYVDDFVNKIVDSLMIGEKNVGKEQILALMTLKESVDENSKDLAELVYDIVSNMPAWKQAYRENVESIKAQIGNMIESIGKAQVEAKYSPLYDGTIPEDKFPLYLEPARKDIVTLEARLAKVESSVEKAYLPFDEDKNLDAEDKETAEQFIAFAEGLNDEVHNLREHLKLAIDNENCAMCLGQIHDAVAESLTDYEIAGSFIEKMASRFAEAA